MTGFAPTVPLASHVTRHVAGGKKTVKAQFHVPKSGSGDDVRVLAAPVSVPYCAVEDGRSSANFQVGGYSTKSSGG
jgi:hypothetical protein